MRSSRLTAQLLAGEPARSVGAVVNGIFKPIALVDGICRATWSLPKGRVSVPLEGFEAEAADVERFLAG